MGQAVALLCVRHHWSCGWYFDDYRSYRFGCDIESNLAIFALVDPTRRWIGARNLLRLII